MPNSKTKTSIQNYRKEGTNFLKLGRLMVGLHLLFLALIPGDWIRDILRQFIFPPI